MDSNTGITGISYVAKRNDYLARLHHKGRIIEVGRFVTLDAAIEARNLAVADPDNYKATHAPIIHAQQRLARAQRNLSASLG